MLASQKREKVMTADEVAEWLGTHPESVRRAARAGRLPGKKFAGAWRFKQSEVEKTVFGNEEKGGDEET